MEVLDKKSNKHTRFYLKHKAYNNRKKSASKYLKEKLIEPSRNFRKCLNLRFQYGKIA